MTTLPNLTSIHFGNFLLVLLLVWLAWQRGMSFVTVWGGAVLGAVLMGVNFWVLGWAIKRLLSGRAGVGLAIFLAFKALFLALAVFLLLHYLAASPLGVVAGMVAVMAFSAALLIGQILMASRKK